MIHGLNRQYSLGRWKGKNKGKFVINLPASSYLSFTRLIRPHMVDSMMQKLKIRLFESFSPPLFC